MTSDKSPYDPKPERGDAFGEQAKAGYAAVPDGDHSARLARLRARTQGAPQAAPSGGESREAVVRQLSPKPATHRAPKRQVWWTAAAAIALFVVAALVYQLGSRPDAGGLAKVYEPNASASQAPATAADNLWDGDSATQRPEIEEAEAADPVVADAAARPRPAPVAAGPTSLPIRVQGEPAHEVRTGAPLITSQSRPAVAPGAVPDGELGTAPSFQREVVLPTGTAAESIAQEIPESPPSPAAVAKRPAAPRTAERPTPDPDGASSGNALLPTADQNPATSSYTLQRSDVKVALRTLPVRVTTLDGYPLSGARIDVEGTGQAFTVDQDGHADLQLLPGARVARAVAPDQDTLYFDVSGREDLTLLLAGRSPAGRVSNVVESRSRRDLVALGPPAAPFPGFDAYARRGRGPLAESGSRAELQFYVSRQGRPTGISRSPAFEGSRVDYQRAKELLQAGPDWPEAYRGKRWRYVVE